MTSDYCFDNVNCTITFIKENTLQSTLMFIIHIFLVDDDVDDDDDDK